MLYLIDGYNLIFSLIETKETLQTLRQQTIRYLQKKFASRGLEGMLVFDGAHKRDDESGLSYPSPLIVAYAPKGQSADAYIIEQVEIAKNPKQITVITNDQGLIRHIRAANAKVMSNSAFINWLKKKKDKKPIREIKESPQNIDRLEKIFEERFRQLED